MYTKWPLFQYHLSPASYYSKIMFKIGLVSTPYMEVISGGNNLKVYLHLSESIMLAEFWNLIFFPRNKPSWMIFLIFFSK